jgi:hypothetical protein
MVANTTDGALGIVTSSNICPVKYPSAKQSYMDELWQSGKEDLLSKVDNMLSSLKMAMTKPPTTDF